MVWAPSSAPLGPRVMAQTAVPAFGRWRPEGQDFKVTVGYKLISRPVWAGTEEVGV